MIKRSIPHFTCQIQEEQIEDGFKDALYENDSEGDVGDGVEINEDSDYELPGPSSRTGLRAIQFRNHFLCSTFYVIWCFV